MSVLRRGGPLSSVLCSLFSALGHGEWSAPSGRDIDCTTRGARVRAREAIESIRPWADQMSVVRHGESVLRRISRSTSAKEPRLSCRRLTPGHSSPNCELRGPIS
jgi:hypothetical protein